MKQRLADSLRGVAKGVIKPVPHRDAMKVSLAYSSSMMVLLLYKEKRSRPSWWGFTHRGRHAFPTTNPCSVSNPAKRRETCGRTGCIVRRGTIHP